MLPGYNKDDFPFIVFTSVHGIDLINIRKDKENIQPLIVAASSCSNAQQNFFIQEEKVGMTLQFTSSFLQGTESTRLSWSRMNFKPEFKKTLKEFGGLPN